MSRLRAHYYFSTSTETTPQEHLQVECHHPSWTGDETLFVARNTFEKTLTSILDLLTPLLHAPSPSYNLMSTRRTSLISRGVVQVCGEWVAAVGTLRGLSARRDTRTHVREDLIAVHMFVLLVSLVSSLLVSSSSTTSRQVHITQPPGLEVSHAT